MIPVMLDFGCADSAHWKTASHHNHFGNALLVHATYGIAD